jgi:cytochrome P450
LIIANLKDDCVPSKNLSRSPRRKLPTFETEIAALLSPSAYADDAAMNTAFARLRRLSPVHWVDVSGIEPFWAVTRHADVLSVELRNREFTAQPRTYLSSKAMDFALQQVSGKPQVMRGLTEMDDPDHGRYRAILQRSFSSAALLRIEEWLRDRARVAVDAIANHSGICDFAVDIAMPFTMRVIAHLLGFPEADDAQLLRLAHGFVGAEDPQRRLADEPAEAMRLAMRGLRDYVEAAVSERRLCPRDDLASLIANAKIDGQDIPHYELISYFYLMLIGGHDTVALALAGGLHALLTYPDQFARLREQPELLDCAIEEMFRWTSPLRHFMRTAQQNIEVGGQQVRAGQALALFFGSANRDEAVFADADTFRVDRSPNPHIAFGHGSHFCMGYHLARMEMRALFSELLEKVEYVELAGEVCRARSAFISGIISLPARFKFRQRTPVS